MPVNLSPQSPPSSSNELMNKVAVMAGMNFVHGLPFIKADPALLLASGINIEPPGGTIPCDNWPAMCDRLITLHCTVEGVAFCSYSNRCSGYGFAFPVCNASAKTTIRGLTECLVRCYHVLHSIASDQVIHFMTK